MFKRPSASPECLKVPARSISLLSPAPRSACLLEGMEGRFPNSPSVSQGARPHSGLTPLLQQFLTTNPCSTSADEMLGAECLGSHPTTGGDATV